jgi:hypothetical protein
MLPTVVSDPGANLTLDARECLSARSAMINVDFGRRADEYSSVVTGDERD